MTLNGNIYAFGVMLDQNFAEIVNNLHNKLPNSILEKEDLTATKHYSGGGSVTGIDLSTGNFTYTSSNDGDREIRTFSGYKIMTNDELTVTKGKG